MEAILNRNIEHKLVWAFIGLNALDALFTTLLVSRGYLYGELNPIMRDLFMTDYSYVAFWVVKMGLALVCVPVFYLLAEVAPRLRRLIFVLPVVVLAVACIINIVGYVVYG